MPMPVVNPIALRIYEAIVPATYADEQNDWALLQFIHAWTRSMMFLEDIVRDEDTGPGWHKIMDPDTAPSMFLDWLGMMAGVTPFTTTQSDQEKRDLINGMAGLRRGTTQAMRAALLKHLSGTKTVYFNERQGGNAYQLLVVTLLSETDDEAGALAALLSQKPAGIILTYDAVDGLTYTIVKAGYATYATIKSERATYLELKTIAP